MANCYKSDSSCANTLAQEVEGIGLTVSCCTKHWVDLLDKINGDKDLDADFLSDYAKIYIMMENQTDVIRCLMKLASQLADFKESSDFEDEYKSKEGGGSNYIKLSMALSKFESFCWFPPSHEIFIGFLPSDSFQSYIARGLMSKDPGAGVLHGDFTHRIHWHCISRIITNDFSVAKRQGWEKSPLELFCSLGRTPATSGGNNVWFKLMDEPCSTFRHPDVFHGHIRTGNYGLLSANVARRFVKRDNAFKDLLDPKLSAIYKQSARSIPAPMPNSPDRTISAYKDYYQRMEQKSKDVYSENKLRAALDGVGSYETADGGLPVLRKKGAVDGMTIEQRLAMSLTGLNKVDTESQDYSAYNETLGIVTRKGGYSNLSALQNNPNRNK